MLIAENHSIFFMTLNRQNSRPTLIKGVASIVILQTQIEMLCNGWSPEKVLERVPIYNIWLEKLISREKSGNLSTGPSS
jgi:hypothetical protein